MSDYGELGQEALEYLRNHLRPERALVAFGGEGWLHGLPVEGLWLSAPISHQILKQALESGRPFNSVDASQDPRYGHRTSVLLAEIRSVICIPMVHSGNTIGLIYADNRVKTGAFEDEDFNLLSNYVRDLTARVSKLWPPAIDWDKLQNTRFTA